MDRIDFTTASREEIRGVYDAIAAEMGDDRFFTTKELDVLPKILSPGEQVLSFSSGLMDGNTWLIVLTDKRVLFLDKGLLFGLKQTSINLGSIVTLQGETGLMFGTIRISAASGPQEIRNVWKKTVNPFVNRVNDAMDAHRRGVDLRSPGWSPGARVTDAPVAPPPPPPPAPTHSTTPAPSSPPPSPQPPSDVAAQLARLDRLRAAGSIDEREYQSSRAGLGA